MQLAAQASDEIGDGNFVAEHEQSNDVAAALWIGSFERRHTRLACVTRRNTRTGDEPTAPPPVVRRRVVDVREAAVRRGPDAGTAHHQSRQAA